MNLLIIDDEYYIVQGLEGMIDKEELGVDRIFTAYSAQQGLNILKKEQVDLMLLDVEMPKETGLELLEQLSKEGLQQPTTLILSGHQRFDYAQEAMHYHCFNYLLKPIGKQDLNQELQRAITSIGQGSSRPAAEPEPAADNDIQIDTTGFVHTVRAYIREHLSDPDLNRVKIADAIHLNPDYLSFCFHKEFDTTLTAYITSKRMDQAKYLLKNSSLSITEIAEQVGIPNTSYFYRQFKKATGKTPQQFRK